MDNYKISDEDINQSTLREDGGEIDFWAAAEEKSIEESLSLSYTQRFRIMMRLMRISNMLSRAKITHKKML